ncbi:MAG: ATP-binding cassette domain-containing protein [Solirubrobacteraceae bacterium]
MSDALQFLLIGLGLAGVYGLAALGLVLVHRGTGVVNFAHGGVALVAAVVFVEVRPSLGTWPAVLVGLLVGAAIGAAIELVVMRRLAGASSLVRTVATIALLAVCQQAVLLWQGSTATFVPPILPQGTVGFGGDVSVGVDRLILFAALVVATIALSLVLGRTRMGLAVTASAENARAAAALGHSPRRIALATWTAGGLLAGAAGVFVAPLTSLSATSTPMLVIPALAAALVGRLVSLPGALVGALVVGIAEAQATRWVTAPGWAAAVPFLVIVVVLLVRRDALTSRSLGPVILPAVAPVVRRPLPWVIALASAALLVAVGSEELTAAATATFASAIIGLSLVVLTGYAGQLSLAQFALAGVAALVAGRLADAGGLAFLPALVCGAAAAGGTGLLFGALALRTRGVALAIVTLGLGTVINGVVFANPDYTGGPIEGTVIGAPSILGLDVSYVAHPTRYALVCLALLALALLMVRNVRAGAVGRRLLATRANAAAAEALGVRTASVKLYAFVLSSAMAGVGGVLLAFRNTNLDFSGYGVMPSNQILLLAVLGGIGFMFGGVIAGLAAVGGVVSYVIGLGEESHVYMLVVSVLLLLQLAALPDGIAELLRERIAHLRARPGGRRALGRRQGDDATLAAASAPTEVDIVDDGDAPAPDVADRAPRHPLQVHDLSVDFGGVRAVDGVSLSVNPGEVVGLIGPNGAGKSTVIDAITGRWRHYEGSVRLGEEPLERLPAWARARAGVGRSFQSLELFEDMTVRDNLRVAAEASAGAGYLRTLVRPTGGPLPGVARGAARDLGLLERLDDDPRSLPYAARRLLAVARAASRDPGVLLLDEPAAGLDGPDRVELSRLIRALADERGIAVLLVEHDVAMVMEVSDRVVVLDRGRVVADGPPEEVRRDPAVVDAYLGRTTEVVA